MRNLTDSRKTVETGMDPRLSFLIFSRKSCSKTDGKPEIKNVISNQKKQK